ncbi:cytochrome c maturation protein CcmE [Deinococcus sp.]|uniref:cytochrome c maturation protein CcmE n=1 Tax=Deinococcus sp. TaxID=47478 RepID=UPI003B5C35B3
MTSPLPQARRRKKNPLPYVLAGAALTGLLAYIVFGNLAQSIEYFVTPTEYQAQEATFQGRTVRIGGLVKAVKYDRQTLKLHFDVTDGGATFPVIYKGAVSDLFKVNQGVVVRGQFSPQNVFMANELIVKHSEEYRVPQSQSELKNMLKNAKDANAEGS